MSRTTVPCAHQAHDNLNRKRLVICCDGTWNNSNDTDSPATNVSRLAGAVAHKCCSGMPQVIYYHPGAGTESSWVAKKLGGLLGLGVVQDIAETYRFICDNYNPGDEIILIGFSRGAFTARSVADMICNLGFLNRAGLDHLGDFFHDYSTWEEWADEEKFDPSKHLVGFCIENYDQVQRRNIAWKSQNAANLATDTSVQGEPPGSMKQRPKEAKSFQESMLSSGGAKTAPEYAKDLEDKMYDGLLKQKQILWEKIRAAKTRAEISALYRQELFDHRLALTEKAKNGDSGFSYVPCPAKVKAVGVWDTVGSLGVPKGPWRAVTGGRSDDEIRFASLEMHPNVQHAFHALALDEYRSAFGPTLWELGAENTTTVLRQVWFAGNHGDVGGGWEDEQSANIALAWMADQLSSVGVEFSRPEMQRVFYDVRASAVPQAWGMAQIHNPPPKTAALDVAVSSATFNDPTPRKPGLYYRDATVDKSGNVFTKFGRTVKGWVGMGPDRVKLSTTEELVHPSVRLRYQYKGSAPKGEEGPYRCRALIQNGYRLKEIPIPKPRKAPSIESPEPVYKAVSGNVAAFRNDSDLGDKSFADVPGTTPLVRVQQPHEECDVVTLPPAQRGWMWVRPAQGKDEAEVKLYEEQIGLWERLYMKVQEELVDWKPLYEARQAKLKAAEDAKQWAAVRVAGTAASGVGNLLAAPFGAIRRWRTSNPDAEAAVAQTILYNAVWGYHDLIVWLKGDVRKLFP
ncbi:hypothetical protein BN1708_001368 [Verticillium longisporum]|uniref:T6SS Phospholipase effector Tle1-like catalytic domain-containing protein n=1 Tax=Verticillium longisporum TaxID=100787 RepID=A0A0G4MTN3_VERLO|nr:hypothetical protein BN1708_001368 [Verticillium longisporum]